MEECHIPAKVSNTSKRCVGRATVDGFSVAFCFPFVALRCVFLVHALAVLGALLAVFLATAMMFGAFGAAPHIEDERRLLFRLFKPSRKRVFIG